MLLRPSVNDNSNNNSREENNINNKSSDNTNNMLRATINNTPTDTGIRPVLSFTNLFNRGGHSNQKVQPNNNNNSINNKRSNSTPVLNNSASTNSMKQQWPCDLSLSNTSIYHNSMQNYNNYDSEETESNTSQSMGVQSSTSVASTSDIDKSDTTERASNNAMDVFLSKAGINKQQQSKLQSMRLQQKQQGLLQQNNIMGNSVQHVQLNDMKSKTQLNNNNNANSILSRMVMVGGSGSGDTNNNNNNNGMPIRIASITDFRQSQGNAGSNSRNSSMGNLRQSNRSSISSRSRASISRLNSRSSLGSVPENNVSTQNLSNSQWSLDRPDNTTSSNQQNQGSNGNEVFKNLTRRRSSNISSASQPNLRQRGGSGVDIKGGKNEQWSDPQTMVKAAGQRGEDIFAKLQELRLQKQIVMEKKEAVLKNSQRWSQPEMLSQMGSSMRGLSDSIKGVGGSANDKNEEWPTSSSEEAGDTKSTAQSVFQRDDKIDEIITLKLKIANQQATIDTLSSKLKTSSQDVIKPEVSHKTIKELETEKQSLTKQLQECQMREYKLVKELKAQQDDHEREMKQMEEKNLMLRKALEDALNSQQKSSISSGGSSRSKGSSSRRKTISTRSTSDDESEDEDLAFKTDDQLDDSTKNKSYAWY